MSQYLSFIIAGDEFAMNILSVREILEYQAVTRVPSTPQWIRGVLNLRGSVIPVVDLAVKFGGESRPVTSTSCVVIVEAEHRGEQVVIGVLSDQVRKVADVDEAQIRPAPEFGTGVPLEFLRGVALLDDSLVLVLDVNRVLSPGELTQAHGLTLQQAAIAEAAHA